MLGKPTAEKVTPDYRFYKHLETGTAKRDPIDVYSIDDPVIGPVEVVKYVVPEHPQMTRKEETRVCRVTSFIAWAGGCRRISK